MPAAFLADHKERGALTTVVHDGSVPAHNPGEAPVTIPEGRPIGVKKSLGVSDRGDTGIGIFAIVVPYEDAAVRYHTCGIIRIRPEVDEVASMAQPLVEDSCRVVLVQAKLEVFVRIEWLVWLAQQPAIP